MHQDTKNAIDALILQHLDALAVTRGIALQFQAMEWTPDNAAEPGGGSVLARILLILLRHNRLTADQGKWVAQAWAYSQHPQDALTDDEWRALFGFSGYLVNREPAQRPEGDLYLFRGAAEQFKNRWSWTDDRGLARRFADGTYGRLVGRVWSVTAPSDRLLAMFTQREGVEYIVDVEGLHIFEGG